METDQERIENVDLNEAGDHRDNTETKPDVVNQPTTDSVIESKPADDIGEQAEETETEQTEVSEKEEWVDIIGSGDLKKKVIKEGEGVDTRPTKGEVVTLRTKGELEDGKLVDVNENVKFSVGDGDMLQAWEICIPLMELGEICTLITTPRFAYGDVGRDPDIPANATITYDIELLKVEDEIDLAKLPLDKRCKMADDKRTRGNELFTRNDHSGAINSYTRALAILDADESPDKDSFKQLQLAKIKCYNNLAAAQIKVGAYDAALKSCDWVIRNEKDNTKALFRKGKVLASQGLLTEALEVTKKALKLEPSNKIIHQELSRLLAKQSEQKEEEKRLYKKMVGDMANVAENTAPQKTKMKNRFAFLALLTGLLAVITAVLVQSTSE